MLYRVPVCGYTDIIGVRAGQVVSVMVTCDAPTFELEVVRFERGAWIAVENPIAGVHDGVSREAVTGSFIAIPLGDVPWPAAFVLDAWVQPTLTGGCARTILAAHTRDATAFVLRIAPDGRVELEIGRSLVRGDALVPGRW